MKTLLMGMFALGIAMNVQLAEAAGCKIEGNFAELSTKVAVSAKRTYRDRQSNFIRGIRAEQILKTIEEVVTGRRPTNLRAAFAEADGGFIYKLDFTSSGLPADYYTVIYLDAGSTQVGLIFEGETSNIVAQINDGEIDNCKL